MLNAKDFKEIFGAEPPKTDWDDDFLRGQMDCDQGKPHKSGQSDAYNRGYATQYEMEQVQEVMSYGNR